MAGGCGAKRVSGVVVQSLVDSCDEAPCLWYYAGMPGSEPISPDKVATERASLSTSSLSGAADGGTRTATDSSGSKCIDAVSPIFYSSIDNSAGKCIVACNAPAEVSAEGAGNYVSESSACDTVTAVDFASVAGVSWLAYGDVCKPGARYDAESYDGESSAM